MAKRSNKLNAKQAHSALCRMHSIIATDWLSVFASVTNGYMRAARADHHKASLEAGMLLWACMPVGEYWALSDLEEAQEQAWEQKTSNQTSDLVELEIEGSLEAFRLCLAALCLDPSCVAGESPSGAMRVAVDYHKSIDQDSLV